MTAPELSDREREIVERFEAAPVLEEAWQPMSLNELGKAARAAGWRPMDDPAPAAPGTDHSGEVEAVARAIYEADVDFAEQWDDEWPSAKKRYRRLARAALAARRPATEALRDALRAHHPIMRSETGPFSGCRCGQVKLGQDVIAHVVEHLRAALGQQP